MTDLKKYLLWRLFYSLIRSFTHSLNPLLPSDRRWRRTTTYRHATNPENIKLEVGGLAPLPDGRLPFARDGVTLAGQ